MASEDAETISQAIMDAVTSPAVMKGDAGEVTERSLSDLIQADRYVAAKTAATNGRRGLRFSRLIPDGTVQR